MFQPFNVKQMGSTFFGDTVVTDASRTAAPQKTQADRGAGGRVSGFA